jgi:hypothetical protein
MRSMGLEDLFDLTSDIFRAYLRGFSREEKEEEEKGEEPINAHKHLGSDSLTIAKKSTSWPIEISKYKLLIINVL